MSSHGPRHVLIVKIAAIGDCLNMLPAARALRHAFPDTRLTWLVGRAAADAVVGQVPLVDWIVVDDAVLIRPRPLAQLGLVRVLRGRRPDAALILHRTRSVRLLAFSTGARRRVGLVRSDSDRALLTDAVVDSPDTPESERYWRAAERLCGHALPRNGRGWIPPPVAASEAQALWRSWGWTSGDEIVALAPGGGVNPRTRFDLKRWPTEKFAELARRLFEEPRRRVLVLGLPDEIERFQALAGAPGRMQGAAGSLRLAGALLARSDACVANDSGLMHLAAAVGVPTVGIFGPTNPAVWGPAGPGHHIVRHIVPCQPCYKDDGVLPTCDWEHRCMQDLGVPEVLDAVTMALQQRRRDERRGAL
jgi:ADP-heptose:LPS heptosyltransferase